MYYSVEVIDNNRGISLKGWKQHISLYAEDLRSLIEYNVSEQGFVSRVESWLRDIICDEYGSDNVTYDSNALLRAIKTAYKNLREDFVTSPEYDAAEEKRIADKAKHDADIDKIFGVPEINPIVNSIYRSYNLSYAQSVWQYGKGNKRDNAKMESYRQMERYIYSHKEEFIPLSDAERVKLADKVFNQYMNEYMATH